MSGHDERPWPGKLTRLPRRACSAASLVAHTRRQPGRNGRVGSEYGRSSIWVERTACRRWTGPSLPTSSMRGRRRGRTRRTPHDVAVHHQRRWQPACDCGRCPLGGRYVLVPDGRGYAQGTQRHARSAVFGRGVVRDADVVIEGDAVRVNAPDAMARVAKAWADNGWPAEPDESGSGITAPFNAPSQGPPPWDVYRIEPRSATVVLATDPGGLTRFRF